MKKLLSLLFIHFLVSACIMPDGIEVETEYIDYTDTYHFYNIEYIIEEDDYVRPCEEIWHKRNILQNYTNVAAEVKFNLYDNLLNYSCFHGINDTEYDLYKEDYLQLQIPSNVDEQGYIWVTTFEGNIFKENYYPAFDHFGEQPCIVPAYTGLDVEYNERSKELRLTYLATFVGKKYGRHIIIKGKWEGKQQLGHNHTGFLYYDLDRSKSQ